MIDKNLLHLLGGNKKYIFIAVALMVVGLFANVGTPLVFVGNQPCNPL